MTTMTRTPTRSQSDPGPTTQPAPTTQTAQPAPAQGVIAGIDTHRDQHVVALIDALGRLLAVADFESTEAGHHELLEWARSYGELLMVGIEGTGSYGLGLARYLAEASTAELVEIDRPDRRSRRKHGKSDALDAEAAARAAWSRSRNGVPKIRDGAVEALRNLRVARRSAVDQRSDVVRQMKSLIVTTTDDLRAQLRALTTPKLIKVCTTLRPDLTRVHEPAQATKASLRSLAKRHTQLSAEIEDLEALIDPLVAKINPALLAIKGVGPDCAGQFLITAGANPERISTPAAFAMLCGAAPVPASSGQTQRMRLNRGGDRRANAALYRIVITRMRWEPRTQAYITRRVNNNDLTKKEAVRCLKNYISREIYQALINPHLGLDNP
jgi:transposase